MKLSKLFFGVAAAAMFAACSSDDIVVAEKPQAQWNEDGTGYIALNVAMPVAKATRANDVFDDGLTNEYDVKNGVLLLFAGDDEPGAKLYAAYDLTATNFGTVGTSTDNVTSDRLIVQKIDRPATPAAYLGAFVVLNTNNNFIVDPATHKLTAPTSITTLESLLGATKDEIGKGQPDFKPVEFIDNGFMMTNAPLYTAVGGTTLPAGNIQVLAEVDQSKIKGTKNEASQVANCAANIYVERAVAKVTMHKVTDKAVTTVSTPGQTNFTWTLDSWALDNTNKISFLTRNSKNFEKWDELKSVASTDYRFVGGTPIAGASTQHTGSSVGAGDTRDLYRTYWAEDPNYTVATPSLNVNIASDTHYAETFGNEHPQYCAENTFAVKYQDWNNTTRVLLKTTMKPDATAKGTLYGRPGDEGFLDETNVGYIAETHALKDIEGRIGYSELGVGGIQLDHFTSDPATGEITVFLKGDALDHPTGPAGTTLANELKTTGVKYLPSALELSYYKGGVVYYQARIRHFDDSQTPWNKTEYMAGYAPANGGTTTIYPDATDSRQDKNYLGRWGVLRNNWYDLQIDKVTKLGYATPGELVLDNTPDDDIESWISLDVNILSWAKRTNTIDL